MYRKNHYIPEYYLKKFTDSKNQFWVYDKSPKFGKPTLNIRSPSQVCFEWDRYTLEGIPENDNKILEKKTYSYYDSLHARTFSAIEKSTINSFIWTQEVVLHLEHFIPLVFWRSPVSNNKLSLKFSKAEFIDEFGISMWSDKTNEKITDKEFHKKVLNDKNIRKAIIPFLAMSTFLGKGHPINDKLEWRINYGNESDTNLTSDNPIIFRNEPETGEDFRSFAILPASSNKTLIRINEKAGFDFIHKSLAQDVLIFDQAVKFVICSSKSHLEKVIELHSQHNTRYHIAYIKENMFDIYEPLSPIVPG